MLIQQVGRTFWSVKRNSETRFAGPWITLVWNRILVEEPFYSREFCSYLLYRNHYVYGHLSTLFENEIIPEIIPLKYYLPRFLSS